MEMEKLKSIYDQMILLIEREPEKALPSLKSELQKLSFEEIEVLSPFIKRYYDSSFPNSPLPFINQMYLVELLNSVNDTREGYEPVAALTLTGNTNAIEITRFFYDLKTNGYIQNTNEQIAAAIAELFNLNYGTIYTYLKTPSRVNAAKQIVDITRPSE